MKKEDIYLGLQRAIRVLIFASNAADADGARKGTRALMYLIAQRDNMRARTGGLK